MGTTVDVFLRGKTICTWMMAGGAPMDWKPAYGSWKKRLRLFCGLPNHETWEYHWHIYIYIIILYYIILLYIILCYIILYYYIISYTIILIKYNIYIYITTHPWEKKHVNLGKSEAAPRWERPCGIKDTRLVWPTWKMVVKTCLNLQKSWDF